MKGKDGTTDIKQKKQHDIQMVLHWIVFGEQSCQLSKLCREFCCKVKLK